MKYDRPKANQWVWPRRRGYKLVCCDCALVHRIDFVVDGRGRILIRLRRDERATAAIRREARKRSDKRLREAAVALASYYSNVEGEALT